jgi:hypothetical protein
MLKHLQQIGTAAKNTSRKAGVSMRSVTLNSSSTLILGLVLIIPTISGVAVIA